MPHSKTALLIIDYQKAFSDRAFWGLRNNLGAEDNAARVLGACRKSGVPVIHIRHDSKTAGSPLRPGQSGHDPMEFAIPLDDEQVIAKSVNSGFIGTDLEERLKAMGIGTLIIVGVTTDHCVSTTTRMASNLGFEVMLVGDACFTFDRTSIDGSLIEAQTVHQVELAILNGEFAKVVSTETLLADLKQTEQDNRHLLQMA